MTTLALLLYQFTSVFERDGLSDQEGANRKLAEGPGSAMMANAITKSTGEARVRTFALNIFQGISEPHFLTRL